MKKSFFFPLQVSLCTFGCLYASGSITYAQVTSDGTVNTQVNQNGNVAEITGGETRGGNLFHSFQDFSVPTGNEAFFNNANDISHIFSRVTGGNISNIDGTIRANGSASLFLINPAGIIFGENARLDLGGSFYGSTADSILFEDGEFSASDLENTPVLTINAPIGLGLRDNSGDIVNRSAVRDSAEEVIGLEVNPGNNLTFVANNLNFEGGSLTASGGDIYLGAISESGTVEISENGNLSFAEGISRGDITLSNSSEIDVRGSGGGNIAIDVRNLNLERGELGISSIRAGIQEESTVIEAQAGDITIDATGNLFLNEGEITNNVELEGFGTSGNVFITTDSLSLLNGGLIATITRGQGDAGAVNVTATGDITIDGERDVVIDNGEDSFILARASGITSRVFPEGVGNSGGVTVSTNNLTLTNGGRVDAGVGGQGNAGLVNVIATGDIIADGEISRGIPSQIASRINPDAIGDAAGVTVSTNNLTLTNGGRVDASTDGRGNAGAVDVTATGDIIADGERLSSPTPSGITSRVTGNAVGDPGGVTVSTSNLTLTNGGRVDASTDGQGDAGVVNVTATGDIAIDGENSNGSPGGITSRVDLDGQGDAGGVTISTNNLTLTNGGNVSASTFGQGNAAAVDVTARDIIADGEGSNGFSSGIFSTVDINIAERNNATGNSGGVIISTNNLNLTNGGRVDASTFGRGNAGAVRVTATENITADGQGSRGISGIFSTVDTVVSSPEERDAISQPAVGNSGGVTISTNNLTLTSGGSVDASTFAQGNAGPVDVTATGDITIDGARSGGGRPSGIISRVYRPAVGNAGGVRISTNNLTLTNGGRVDASTAGQGNAGEVNVTATGNITVDGERSPNPIASGIRSRVNSGAEGNSGGVTIFTTNLNLTNGGVVSTSTESSGNAGNINIAAETIQLIDNARIETVTQFEGGESGIINLQVAEDIILKNNSTISAEARNNADGGNINIDSRFIIAFPSDVNGNGNDIIANAEDGEGGNIQINSTLLGIRQNSAEPNNRSNDIDASSRFNLDGNITINTPDNDLIQATTELSTDLVVPEKTREQACRVNRGLAAQNGLYITGKGGIPHDPGNTLNSFNTYVDGELTSVGSISAPIETVQGKIQPARGIGATKSGEIILTAYRTNNSGDRLPKIRNCV